jgi:hypothetical protein
MRRICCPLIPATAPDSRMCLQVTGIRSALESQVLPKLRSLESILQPINRLPRDVFTLIPCFFTKDWGDEWSAFPMNKPLITMTHVCRSWRNVLLSTPSLWTQLDFSTSNSKQAKGFLRRSGNHPLVIYQYLRAEDHAEPFLSTTLHNVYRIRRLRIVSWFWHFEPLFARFTRSAPELEHLYLAVDDPNVSRDVKLPGTIFGGQLPKLTSLSLAWVHTNLRDFNFPSLTRFDFATGTEISVRDLTSFFGRCPSLEFIKLRLSFSPKLLTAPPKKRVRLAALKELNLDEMASTSGLVDHLILPKCAEVLLKGQFTGEKFDQLGEPAARIHPSSINYLSVMRGITKAVATPNSCVFSGPNGNLRFFCFEGTRDNFDAEFFTSFSPIPISEIRELLVGKRTQKYSSTRRRPWGQTAARVHGAFGVLTKVEDLTIVSCEMAPFFAALGTTADGAAPLPGLRKLTTYVGCGNLDISALIQCARARLECSQPLKEVTIIFEDEPGADVIQEVQLLREFVGELNYRVDATPVLNWEGESGGSW